MRPRRAAMVRLLATSCLHNAGTTAPCSATASKMRRMASDLVAIEPSQGHGAVEHQTHGRPSSRYAFAERRTPGRSPFVNSIPAVSSALTNAATVEAWAAKPPGFASSRLTVGSDTDEASARSRCSQRSKALAARMSSLVIWGSATFDSLSSVFKTSGIDIVAFKCNT
jgi:hypothetical protein